MFPERKAFKQKMPAVLKKFKNICCIIDCADFFCEVPRDYGRQGNTWSSYKHHTTMKCLIAISPTGGACFISDLFEGSIDDVKHFKESGILEYIQPGNSLLVDRGFTIQELLLPKLKVRFAILRAYVCSVEEKSLKKIICELANRKSLAIRYIRFNISSGIVRTTA